MQEIYHHLIFDFSSIGYGQIFQYFLLYTLGMAVSQDIWQRVFTARTEKIARNGSIFAGVYSIAYAIAGSVIGMCAYLLLPNAESSQSIFATLAVQILPQGLLGLVLAGVCFGADVNCFRNAACVFYAD